MNTINTIQKQCTKAVMTLTLMSVLFACEVEYIENPNESVVVPASGLLSRVQKGLLDDTRNESFSGDQMLQWVQYWGQTMYTEQGRYLYEEPTNLEAWNDIYANAQDLVGIIELNTDAATKSLMEVYGTNEAQIATARVMLVYTYLTAVELWGDVPYYSYGSDDSTFQANQLANGVLQASYATQESIYADMLNTLGEAVTVFEAADYVMDGDNFYNGDAVQWTRFTYSLKLRIANRIKEKSADAADFIAFAKMNPELFLNSNADNAGVTYEDNALNGAPMYLAFNVINEPYYSPSLSFVELLKGKSYVGEDLPLFTVDPRLEKYVEKNDSGFYVGIPFVSSNTIVTQFTDESSPSFDIINKADRTVSYMDYAEVCFILSEINDWDEAWYEKGIRASMEQWGVEAAAIDSFMTTVAPASEATVMTQKYIALYMQPMEAWSEYRRTGYPQTLIMPNTTYTMTWSDKDEGGNVINNTEDYSFSTLVDLDDIPYRNKYPINELNINEDNMKAAAARMGGDSQATKLWWME